MVFRACSQAFASPILLPTGFACQAAPRTPSLAALRDSSVAVCGRSEVMFVALLLASCIVFSLRTIVANPWVRSPHSGGNCGFVENFMLTDSMLLMTAMHWLQYASSSMKMEPFSVNEVVDAALRVRLTKVFDLGGRHELRLVAPPEFRLQGRACRFAWFLTSPSSLSNMYPRGQTFAPNSMHSGVAATSTSQRVSNSSHWSTLGPLGTRMLRGTRRPRVLAHR